MDAFTQFKNFNVARFVPTSIGGHFQNRSPMTPYLAAGVLVTLPVLFGYRRWIQGGVNHHQQDQSGKIVLITGGNSGIGYETAKDLASKNATVIITVRSDAKGIEAVQALKNETGMSDIHYILLELDEFHKVKTFAPRLKDFLAGRKIDCLVNNAAVWMLGERTETKDGIETHFSTNHLGPYILTLDLLNEGLIRDNGRIVNVASNVRAVFNFDDYQLKNKYDRMMALEQSKLAAVYFTQELQRRLRAKNSKIIAVSLHPGMIKNQNVAKQIPSVLLPVYALISKIVMKSTDQGAQTSLHCIMAPEVQTQGGKFFVDCQVKKGPEDEHLEKKLWTLSENLTGVKLN